MVKRRLTAGDTTVGNWGQPLGDYSNASAAFSGILRPISVFDHLLGNGMRRVPLKTNIRVITGNVTGHGVSSSSVKPISSLWVNSRNARAAEGRRDGHRVGGDWLSLLRPAASSCLNNELRKAAAAATDQVFLAGLAADETPTASAGSAAANVYTDLSVLVGCARHRRNVATVFYHRRSERKKVGHQNHRQRGFGFSEYGGVNGGEILPGVTALVNRSACREYGNDGRCHAIIGRDRPDWLVDGATRNAAIRQARRILHKPR